MSVLNPQQQKALAITEAVTQSAAIISKLSIQAFRPKRLFRSDKYSRRPGKSKKRSLAKVQLSLTAAFAAVEIYIILSKPIPKNNVPFRSATIHNSN
jgi:hypothetical protein